jgi:hypothetical protein
MNIASKYGYIERRPLLISNHRASLQPVEMTNYNDLDGNLGHPRLTVEQMI